MVTPSLHRVVAAACAELERRREAVNALNVFPVPDGDTGDNMALTARGVLEAVSAGASPDEVARAALLAARGNSGVLLAQWVRGAVAGVGDAPGPALLAAALRAGARAAHDALAAPAPGTILSAMAAAAGGAAASSDGSLAGSLARALAEAQDATERGREQLRELREAGVVDAGAAGFTALLSGALAAFMGRPVAAGATATRAPALAAPAAGPRYCTNLAVAGSDLDPAALARRLAGLGDSLLVVGDASLLRVHLHTDQPEAAEEHCAEAGRVARREVADMWHQARERPAAASR